jgi:hypothetical protein
MSLAFLAKKSWHTATIKNVEKVTNERLCSYAKGVDCGADGGKRAKEDGADQEAGNVWRVPSLKL